MHESEKWKGSRSVVSDSSRPHGPQPIRLPCPWDFPGKSTGVGCHCLLRWFGWSWAFLTLFLSRSLEDSVFHLYVLRFGTFIFFYFHFFWFDAFKAHVHMLSLWGQDLRGQIFLMKYLPVHEWNTQLWWTQCWHLVPIVGTGVWLINELERKAWVFCYLVVTTWWKTWKKWNCLEVYRAFISLILPANLLSTKNHVEETKKHQGEQCLEQIVTMSDLLVYV